MMEVTTVLALVWMHTFADFFLQTDKMAINKSSSNRWMAIHVGVYSLVFVIFSPLFALVNFILHFMTDYVSSRLTTRLWKSGERHWFFVVIGVDQALHMTALLLTYKYMF